MAVTGINYKGNIPYPLIGYVTSYTPQGQSKTFELPHPLRFLTIWETGGHMYTYAPDLNPDKYVHSYNGGVSGETTERPIGTGEYIESVSADRKTITTRSTASSQTFYTAYY